MWEEINEEILASSDRQPDGRELSDIRSQVEWAGRGGDADEDEETRLAKAIKAWKWGQIRDPIMHEPEYEDGVNYSCRVSIRDKFKDNGLQVIVKMATIELTPEKPDFPVGSWHVSVS